MVQTVNQKKPNMGETIRKSRVVGREAFMPEATAHKAAIIPHFLILILIRFNFKVKQRELEQRFMHLWILKTKSKKLSFLQTLQT